MNNFRQHALVDRGPALAQGLLGYWGFDEGSGSTVADRTGRWRPASWVGTLGSQWLAPGYLGGAAGSFDGSTNQINTGATTAGGDAYSLAGWVRYPVFPPAANGAAFSLGKSGQYILAQVTTTGLYGLVQSGPGANSAAGVAPAAGVWHHLAACFEGWCGRHTLYLNGVAIVTLQAATSSWFSNATTVMLGARIDGSLRWNGQLDEVGVWTRALAPREVNWLYNAGKGRAFPFIN